MCDWLFNLQIPDSTEQVIILRPVRKTFITGLASHYDEEYPEELKGRLSRLEFTQMMEPLNDQLGNQFPCGACWVTGYLCCICTLGTSLLCPAQCVNDAEEFARNGIERQNRKLLRERGIEMALVKRCGTSWIELRLTKIPEKASKTTSDMISTLQVCETESTLAETPRSAQGLI